MDKPEDIPLDVWDAALKCSSIMATHYLAHVELIARAILKAKNDAHEEAAQLLLNEATELMKVRNLSVRVMARVFSGHAQAIRNLKHEGYGP